MRTTHEHERKLDAPSGFELPELGGEPLEPQLFHSRTPRRRHGTQGERPAALKGTPLDDFEHALEDAGFS